MGVKFENREVVGAGPPPGNGPVTRYHCVPRLAYAQVTRNSSPRPWSDFEWERHSREMPRGCQRWRPQLRRSEMTSRYARHRFSYLEPTAPE
jgi:hypothetical protein